MKKKEIFDICDQLGITYQAQDDDLNESLFYNDYYVGMIDPMNVGNLLSPMLSALYGSALQQKNSFLMDKLDTKVASDLFTLRDEPHAIGANGSRFRA